VIRATVQHIDQVIEGGAGAFDRTRKPKAPDGVVVCVGLGARFLGGVEDKDVYPMRGQVCLVRAPWVKNCMSMSGGPGRIWTYMIPRRSGDVIIGGTMGIDDW
jgi:D-aspartate oxidase